MGALRVASRRDDDHLTWDEQKPPLNDHEAVTAVRAAERIFLEARAKGVTAFRIEPGKSPQKIDQSGLTAQQILMVPRVEGE